MTAMYPLFDLTGKTAVVTGGAGVLCSPIARMLVAHGARVALLDLAEDRAQALASEIGENAIGIKTDVLDRASIEAAAAVVTGRFGPADILINGAGGNKAQATTDEQLTFFDLPPDAVQWVFNLNFLGTLLASQVFGKQMVEHGQGVILNISSMSAFRPLTRITAYSAAKAAVSNFTQWLAVHIAQEYTPGVRVNALAPGFFMTEQNRFLLTDEQTGNLTPRGQQILDHTPAGRFGTPDDLLGTTLWLVSPASAFVTGTVIPVDGGYNAYSGV
ncbi:MAG: SDR family oxidoreductase [Anaerolineae bacterium]|jgi:NAD(P)-dependent dehydrogenase (short-subunit alcohol dehydrogenase family)|nr:SDR family oxidoreductase [Anaerolineae bacterium]